MKDSFGKCLAVAFLSVVALLEQQTLALGYEAELSAVAGNLVQSLEANGQKSGTVIDFTDLQGQGTELGRFLAQELSDQLVTMAKTVSFVDRANLQHLLRENKLSMDGLINPQTSRKLGNMIGIDTVIFGTVTPMGKTVRLSVRGVAVETGKIVASQSSTLPLTGELAEMNTRSVADNTNEAAATPSRRGLSDRLRSDSIKLVVNELAAGSGDARMSFTILNQSGAPVGIGIGHQSYSAGPCTPNTQYALFGSGAGVHGLPAVARETYEKLKTQPDPRLLHWLPPGAKVSGTIVFNSLECHAQRLSGLTTVPVSITAIVVTDKEAIALPLSADSVQVRFSRD